MVEQRCAATTTLGNLVFTLLKIADTLGELQVNTKKTWVLICPDATALWHTLPDDAAWLQAFDKDTGLNARNIHLKEICTFRVNNHSKKFQRNLTGDGKLMMVTNAGEWWGEMLAGLPRCLWVGSHRGRREQN